MKQDFMFLKQHFTFSTFRVPPPQQFKTDISAFSCMSGVCVALPPSVITWVSDVRVCERQRVDEHARLSSLD